MSNRMVCREASHAGSWYTASGSQLNAQLEGWLSQAQSTAGPARAIIAPHAGYTYCGACAAHAYKQVDPSITIFYLMMLILMRLCVIIFVTPQFKTQRL
uniref:Protein MEMO1 n=1 Tax=Sinocyclocheilus grahami TaxID=75366 RepID=A0A672QJ81_SINGR